MTCAPVTALVVLYLLFAIATSIMTPLFEVNGSVWPTLIRPHLACPPIADHFPLIVLSFWDTLSTRQVTKEN